MKPLAYYLLRCAALAGLSAPAFAQDETARATTRPEIAQAVQRTRKPLLAQTPGTSITATLGVLYFLEEHLSRRAWEKYRAEAEQRGVKLWMKDYARPPIPEVDNFIAIPYVLEAARNPLKRVDLNFLTQTRPGLERPRSGDPFSGRPLKIKAWWDEFVFYKHITEPTGDPGRDVLRLLDQRVPALLQFRAALGRHNSRHPVEWLDNNQVPLDGYLPAYYLARVFRFSIAAYLATGEQDAALRDWQCVFRIADSFEEEPGSVVGAVRRASVSFLFDSLWNGLALHQWSDESLVEIDRQLARLNFFAALRHVANSDRAFINQFLLRLTRMSARERYQNMGGDFHGPSPAALFAIVHPEGFVYRILLLHNRYIDELVARYEPVNGQERTFVPPHETYGEWLQRQTFSPKPVYRYFVEHWNSADTDERTCLRVQASLMQARLACALERYHLQKKAYPETLAELAPAFLPAIFVDPCDGQPMRYRRLEDGGYLLWSVGLDRVDENGKSELDDNSSPDWIWKLPGK